MKKEKSFKKILVLLICMVVSFSFTVQSQSWQWVRKSGGTGGDYGDGVCTDNSGNVYSTAHFSGKAGFGSLGDTLTSYGLNDISIAKYNSSGTLQWAKQIGGTGYDYSKAIHLDNAGNIYLAGYFAGSAYFNSTTNITGAGSNDIFIAKYNNSFQLQWVRTAGGSGMDAAFGLSLDNFGNVYITGYFESTANFGDTTVISTAGNKDAFLAKYDNTGAFKWVRTAKNGFYGANSVCTDPSGNVFITGDFTGTAIFSSTISLTSAGGTADIFTAKYDSLGTVLWAKRAGGTGYDNVKEICSDNSSDVYIVGDFDGTAQFGTLAAVTSAGDRDVFVAKYNTNGDVQWIKRAGGIYQDLGWAIASDTTGNVYITGNYYGLAHFDTISITNYFPPSNPASTDIFLVKYNAAGEAQWAQTAGGSGDNDYGSGICVSPSNDVFITGYINGSVFFQTTNLQIPPSNGNDIYVAKFIQPIVDGIENNTISTDNMIIYPNPVKNQLYIKVNTKETTNAQLKLTNQIGQIIYTENIVTNGNFNKTLSVSSFPKGIYFLQIITKHNSITKKIIID